MDTLADVLRRLGGVSLDRVRFRPFPGTASKADILTLKAREHRLCELVEGVLVEKAPGFTGSILVPCLVLHVYPHVRSRNLGLLTGASGPMEILPGVVRLPDLAFTSWQRLPGRRCPEDPVPRLAPDLVAEVVRPGNTPGEMAVKRGEYFTAGIRLVWEIDPDARTVTVYTSATQSTTLTAADTLDGGAVLPGLTLLRAELFAELDLHD
jgi:Uma2 family endonuclease